MSKYQSNTWCQDCVFLSLLDLTFLVFYNKMTSKMTAILLHRSITFPTITYPTAQEGICCSSEYSAQLDGCYWDKGA